jgi:hypothetical protein
MSEKPSEKISLESLDARIDRLDAKMDKNFAAFRKEMRAGFARSDAEFRKLGLMYEDLDGKFRLLLEGFSGLDRRMESLEKHTEERFAEVDYKFEVIFKRFDDLDALLAKRLGFAI